MDANSAQGSAIVSTEPELMPVTSGYVRFKAYAALPSVREQFMNLLGDAEGRFYLTGVMIAVANSDRLQGCSPRSIMIAALRAASLKLSVDPSLTQAHLVPYGVICTFVPDYHALVQMTESTGWYVDPPFVSEVYEGETVTTERLTGRCTLGGARTGDAVIGWLGYFKTIAGTERWLYWTNEECDAWGAKWNPGGFNNLKGVWQNPKTRPDMRRKTVLRNLVKRWGRFAPIVQATLQKLDEYERLTAEEGDVPDAEFSALPDPVEADAAIVAAEKVRADRTPEQRRDNEKSLLSQLGWDY
jgi:recombination protein RecT